MKKIMILNGAARKNGNTAKLVNAFRQGAEGNGNEVREFYLQGMNIHGCIGCNSCRFHRAEPCSQKDDMEQIYEAFEWADVVVWATPIYFSGMTGPLKTASDRLYTYWARGLNRGKQTALLVTSNMGDIQQVYDWYQTYIRYAGWKDLGIVSGAGDAYGIGTAIDPESEKDAREIGASIC